MSGSGGLLDGYYSQLGQLRSVTDGWRTMPGPVRPLSETTNELTQGAPTWADAWEHNKAAYQDWAEKQRVAGVAAGELDPETGWPTPAGARSAATSAAMGLVMGSTAPEFQAPRIANPLRAYHGSPHEFPPTERNPLGEFDPAKVGTGEGAQVYGTGAAYLAENEGIAQHYRDTLSGAGGRTPGASDGMSQHGINGEYPPTGQAGHAAMDTAIDLDGLLSYMHMYHNQPTAFGGTDMRGSYQRSMDYLKDKIERRIGRFRDELGPQGPNGIAERDMAAQADYYDKHVRDAEPSDVMKRPKGHMYEAEVHIDPEHMLHWDLPLSQQSKYVQERVMSKFGTEKPDGVEQLPTGRYVITANGQPVSRTDGWPDLSTAQHVLKVMRESHKDMSQMTGEQIYKHASTAGDYHDQAAGSQALRDAGIPALRYRDANSRNYRDPNLPKYEAKVARLQADHDANPTEASANRLSDAQQELQSAHRAAAEVKHNFVVFDPKHIDIVRRYGIGALIGGGGAAGAAQGGE